MNILLSLFYALLFLLQGMFGGGPGDAWFYAQDADTNEVVAYNLDRLILLRKRNQKAEPPPKAA